MPPRSRQASEAAYDLIRKRILSCDFAPGASLDEAHLTQLTQLSRTPVREALHRLIAEELVIAMPRGGYRVSSIDLSDYRQMLEAQHIVVTAVTELLVDRITEDGLIQLREAAQAVESAQEANDAAAVAEANARLHILEAELAGNAYLAAMARRVYVHLQRLAFMAFGGMGVYDLPGHYQRVREHHDIYLDALATGDRRRALEIAHAHQELFASRVRQYLTNFSAKSLAFPGLRREAD